MGKFDELTSFVPLLKDDTYGNFVFKNASTQAYQIVWSVCLKTETKRH